MLSKLAYALPLVAGVFASSLHAQITYVETTGTPYQTPALTGYTTLGDEMAGMQVTVNFSDGSTQTGTWATIGGAGSGDGGATAAGYFNLTENGNTDATSAWTLQNLSGSLTITGFTLFGAPGDTTFDRTFGGQSGTPGSSSGLDFTTPQATALGGVTVTYTDILNLTGSPAVGDEFVEVSADFGTGLNSGARMLFSQDTDSAASSGPIVVSSVPDAASTLLLVGGAFSALAGLRRKRSLR